MTTALKSTWQKNAAELDYIRSDGRLLFIIVTTLGVMGLLYLSRALGWPFQWVFRYLCIIPVVLVAYGFGLTAGLISSAFFTAMFVPELLWLWRWNRVSVAVIELLAFMVFLNVLAYLVADSTRILQTQEALTDAVRDSRTLLTAAPELDQVVSYLLSESQRIGRAQEAILLLRSPLDDHWDLIAGAQRAPVDTAHPPNTSLAAWLVERNADTILNDFPNDRRFELSGAAAQDAIQSLLAIPLRRSDGQIMAVLAVINSRRGRFGQAEIGRLRSLVTAGEKALEHASRYARTDRALARRLKQLGAIERTARRINATLDPQEIVQHTLGCAMEIVDGDAGLVVVATEGLPTLTLSQDMPEPAPDPLRLIEVARQLDRAVVLPAAAQGLPDLASTTRDRWLVPIVSQRQALGMVLIERVTSHSGEEASLQALSSLADHAAIALDNVRLFRAIEAERRKAKLIVDTVADGLVTTDHEGYILSLNPAAEELTGWRSDEVVGRLMCQVLGCPGGEQCNRNCSLFTVLAGQRTLHDDHWVIRDRRGMQRVVSLSAAPLLAGGDDRGGMVVRLRDITEQQAMERLQQELIAAFSHELRTPLAYINTVSAMMLAEEDTGESRRHEYLNILMAQSKRLADFADKLLDVSRLESGSWVLQPRPVAIELAVEQVLQRWRTGYPHKTFAFQSLASGVWVRVDENALETVLNSLIDNAVKYAWRQSAITVSIALNGSRFVEISVADEGPGISPQHQEHVFERFYRIHAADNQNTYGYGLGLWVAKQLTEAMGGQIWVNSEVDRYCRFTFTVPVMNEEA